MVSPTKKTFIAGSIKGVHRLAIQSSALPMMDQRFLFTFLPYTKVQDKYHIALVDRQQAISVTTSFVSSHPILPLNPLERTEDEIAVLPSDSARTVNDVSTLVVTHQDVCFPTIKPSILTGSREI